MRTHVAVLLAALVLLPILPVSLQAGSATATFQVSATVVDGCTIQTTPMTFGKYDSLTTHAGTPLDVNGTVTVACSKGTAASIALDPGQYPGHAVGTTRAMKLVSGTDYLSYELYQDIVRTTLWGSTGETLLVLPIAPDVSPRSFFIFGRIPPAQVSTFGTYTDTVVAIVNF